MKQFTAKSGYYKNVGNKREFVSRSTIAIEAENKSLAEQKARNMSLGERKKADWDPLAGPLMIVEEITENKEVAKVVDIKKPEKKPVKDAAISGVEASKKPVENLNKAKDAKAEKTQTQKGPGRPKKVKS